jgi:hypothetical protein
MLATSRRCRPHVRRRRRPAEPQITNRRVVKPRPGSRVGQPGRYSGCTPINIFDLNDPNTIAVLGGRSPASATSPAEDRRIDLNGGLFELPAGTMQLAVGYSYRKEYTRNNVDTSLLINPARATAHWVASAVAAAGWLQREGLYAELFIPIIMMPSCTP